MSAARGLLHAYRGRIDAGLHDALHAVELARELGMPLLADIAAQSFGIAALSTGDAAGAHDLLGRLAEATLASGLREPALCRFLPDEIEALTRLGELGPAEALLASLEARSAQLGRGWGTASACRCRGLLQAARGDLAGAEAALHAGLAAQQRLAMPFERARTAPYRRGSSPAGTAQAPGPSVPAGWSGDLRTARCPTVATARPRRARAGGHPRQASGNRAGADRRRATGGRSGHRGPHQP